MVDSRYKLYYYKNRERILTRKKYLRSNNEYVKEERKKKREQRVSNLREWEKFIPSQSNCQICNKEIFFNKSNAKNAIHFDHRLDGEELIKNNPSNWLYSHKCTEENKKIWHESSFGMLCRYCNLILPSKNRVQWLEAINKYIMAEKGKPLGYLEAIGQH